MRDTFEKVCLLAQGGKYFEQMEAKRQAEEYLKKILLPQGNIPFWGLLAAGEYKPEFLFDDTEILSGTGQHPNHRMPVLKAGSIRSIKLLRQGRKLYD